MGHFADVRAPNVRNDRLHFEKKELHRDWEIALVPLFHLLYLTSEEASERLIALGRKGLIVTVEIPSQASQAPWSLKPLRASKL